MSYSPEAQAPYSGFDRSGTSAYAANEGALSLSIQDMIRTESGFSPGAAAQPTTLDFAPVGALKNGKVELAAATVGERPASGQQPVIIEPQSTPDKVTPPARIAPATTESRAIPGSQSVELRPEIPVTIYPAPERAASPTVGGERPASAVAAGERSRVEQPVAPEQRPEPVDPARARMAELAKLFNPNLSAEDKLKTALNLAQNGERSFSGPDGRKYEITTGQYGQTASVAIHMRDDQGKTHPMLRALVRNGEIQRQTDSTGKPVDLVGDWAKRYATDNPMVARPAAERPKPAASPYALNGELPPAAAPRAAERPPVQARPPEQPPERAAARAAEIAQPAQYRPAGDSTGGTIRPGERPTPQQLDDRAKALGRVLQGGLRQGQEDNGALFREGVGELRGSLHVAFRSGTKEDVNKMLETVNRATRSEGITFAALPRPDGTLEVRMSLDSQRGHQERPIFLLDKTRPLSEQQPPRPRQQRR